jgi:ribosomal protein S18 acetylase RimI-like enzyme
MTRHNGCMKETLNHSALEIQDTCAHVDWEAVRNTFLAVGWPKRETLDIQKAFENSFAVAFVYENKKLIGFGRAISDGVLQAAIYDVVVHPEYQKRGIGRRIVERLLPQIAQCNVILYASPGKGDFYSRLGFRKMKTGMARFVNLERMESMGFIEPEGVL